MNHRADNLDSPYLAGRLNFIVDDRLVVTALSNELMKIATTKDTMLGGHIMAQLPLSVHDRQEIENTFAKARQSGETQTVAYWLDMNAIEAGSENDHSTKPNFEAEITSVTDANGPSGFFIKVRELR
jgi:hypothetical protein